MQLSDLIASVEADFKERGIPLESLFRRAKIDRSTWSRWRAGISSPTLRNWQAAYDSSVQILSETPAPEDAS